jgi:hypothetical protein
MIGDYVEGSLSSPYSNKNFVFKFNCLKQRKALNINEELQRLYFDNDITVLGMP